MNAPQFMAHVAFQQEVTDCLLALSDSEIYTVHPSQGLKAEQEFRTRWKALKKERNAVLSRFGMTNRKLFTR